MKSKLVVAVLGHRDSGKTTTWNKLFGQTVRTGKEIRQLPLSSTEWVEAFLVSGSPEERQLYVGEIIGEQKPSLVLCSMQYKLEVTQTIDYFVDEGYSLQVQWLNPGYSDERQVPDSLGLMSYLLYRGATVCVRDGQEKPEPRVEELRGLIYGWAWSRGKLRSE